MINAVIPQDDLDGLRHELASQDLQIEALLRENAGLHKLCGELERDAKRYRWLREDRPVPLKTPTIPWCVSLQDWGDEQCLWGNDLDVAVDAGITDTGDQA